MKKITQRAINAFNLGEDYKESNTLIRTANVLPGVNTVEMYLFGNKIAEKVKTDAGVTVLAISNGYYSPDKTAATGSRTTMERLNAIEGVHIKQKNFQWYLNGEQWDGQWVVINDDGSFTDISNNQPLTIQI